MIVVTGATGNVGRPLVRALAEAGEKVRAVSCQISGQDVPPGVEHRRVDLAEPADLEPALAGATALFLLASGAFVTRGDIAEVLDIVRGSGVQRVVLLSSQVSSGDHPSELEDAVTRSGLAWTMLRPGNFASNSFQWAESVQTRRTVAAPFGDIALPAMPEPIAERTLDILGSPAPELQRVSPDVEWVLGRPSGTFAEWAARNVVAFK
ncbi:SDR family oxidoreductase [Amycolatopsis taiwanensis]|uniref:NAD(P)-binding domain-containing protein n=1 Tax=Amycolatopsis taiwanensis TaxID=342230 RepID=A0A9W6QX30_9PSEU|nr:NAD(P)H-binding protein [Amycolatopsis taiwanensis]GLY64306.1 hypothetical protein Atai01_09250 [Amycolatopsis taiwanensis]